MNLSTGSRISPNDSLGICCCTVYRYAGWFICLVYYVSSRTVKYVVSITPFVIAPFIVLGDALSGGKIGPALLSFLQTVSGFSHTSPNPYIGMTTFLVLAVLLCGPVFLLLRRAQSNE